MSHRAVTHTTEQRAAFSVVRFQRAAESPDAATSSRVGVRRGDLVREFDGVRDIRELFADWDAMLSRLRDAAAADDGWMPASEVRFDAPVDPRQVIQAGANYRRHVIELVLAERPKDDPTPREEARAQIAAMMDARAEHGTPYCFIGLPTVIAGESAALVLPGHSEKHDWELELGVVIGRPAYRVSEADALAHVAGYTIVNDISTRDLIYRPDLKAIGTDWFRGKNAPGFLPTGPDLVPAEFVGDPQRLGIRLSLNGQVMQDSSTEDMIFGVAKLISYMSQTVPLLPGDLLLTGSPEGNGIHHGRLLRDGDVMVGEIENVGTQTVRCVAEERGA